jgi:hypothetical protein
MTMKEMRKVKNEERKRRKLNKGRKNGKGKVNLVLNHIVAYRSVVEQRPRNGRVQPLLCNKRKNKHPFLSNGR